MKQGLPIFLNELQLLKKQLFQHIAFFIIMPLIISIMYGIFQKPAFEPRIELTSAKVFIDKNTNSDIISEIESLFNSPNFSKLIIPVQNIEDANFSISLADESTIKLMRLKKDKNLEFMAIDSILSEYLKKVNYDLLLTTPAIKSSEYSTLQNALNNSRSTLVEVKTEKSISAKDYYTTSILSFICLLLIYNFFSIHKENCKKGCVPRIFSISLKRKDIFSGYFLYYFVVSFLTLIVFLIVENFINVNIKTPIIMMIITCIIISYFIATLTTCLIVFIKGDTMSTLIPLLLIVFTLLGGTFISLELFNVPALNHLTKLTPNYWIQNAFKNLLNHSNLKESMILLGIILIISLTVRFITLIRINKKWEVL